MMIPEGSPRCVTILYGSQTGTAEDVAERVQRQAYCRHFSIQLSDLDSYPIVSSCICNMRSIHIMYIDGFASRPRLYFSKTDCIFIICQNLIQIEELEIC